MEVPTVKKRSKVARELIGIDIVVHSFDEIGPGRSQMVVRRSCLNAKPRSRLLTKKRVLLSCGSFC